MPIPKFKEYQYRIPDTRYHMPTFFCWYRYFHLVLVEHNLLMTHYLHIKCFLITRFLYIICLIIMIHFPVYNIALQISYCWHYYPVYCILFTMTDCLSRSQYWVEYWHYTLSLGTVQYTKLLYTVTRNCTVY